MKKYFILLATIILIGVLTCTASAAAIGVNVPPGYVIEGYGMFSQGTNEYIPTFIAGLNKNIALGVGYDTLMECPVVLGRYVIVKNVAADLYYFFDDPSIWKADLRGKYFFNESLALAGKVDYTYFSGSMPASKYGIIGQAECLLSQNWLCNGGLYYNYTDFYSTIPSISSTSVILGAEFFTGNIDIGLNCIVPTNDFSKPMFELVVDYLIKK